MCLLRGLLSPQTTSNTPLFGPWKHDVIRKTGST